jgi:hypothetical protein
LGFGVGRAGGGQHAPPTSTRITRRLRVSSLVTTRCPGTFGMTHPRRTRTQARHCSHAFRGLGAGCNVSPSLRSRAGGGRLHHHTRPRASIPAYFAPRTLLSSPYYHRRWKGGGGVSQRRRVPTSALQATSSPRPPDAHTPNGDRWRVATDTETSMLPGDSQKRNVRSKIR